MGPPPCRRQTVVVSILLIDDDVGFTGMMSEYLASEGFECRQANDAFEGIECALTGQHEMAILDVMMPELDGIEVLRRIRRSSSIPIIMLTAKGDSIDRVVGLELGADDYLAKPAFPREVVARVRALLRRVRAEAPAQDNTREVVAGPLQMSPLKREATLSCQPFILTTTEFNILIELVRRPDEVLTKDELSERALHRPREPYDRSIDVHVSNIRQKLVHAGGGVEIETIRAIGYRLRPVP
jgi:two-component system OmpR family response regulator